MTSITLESMAPMPSMAKRGEFLKPYLLGLYENAIPNGMSFRDMLSMTARCGFDRLEISVDESDARSARLDRSTEEINNFCRMIDETGVPIKTMCLCGLHARPASEFMALAKIFESKVTVKRLDSEDAIETNAKSIIKILAQGLSVNTPIEIAADGPDEHDAVEKLLALVDTKFGED